MSDDMSESMDRPFSRFYAKLRRAAGEEPEDVAEGDDGGEPDWIGAPELANPKRSGDGEN
jgi:hypothetical protein